MGVVQARQHAGLVVRSRWAWLPTLTLAALAGCTSLPPAERETLRQASALYERGDVGAATARLDRLIRDYNRTDEIAEAYYIRGLCRTRSGELAAAAEDFSATVARSKRPDLTGRAKASLGSIAWQQGDWTRAAELYSAAVGDLPDQPPTEQILLNAGLAMQRAGRWREATFQFARILRSFPDSPAAAEARRLAAWPHDYFTIQASAFNSTGAAGKEAAKLQARGLESSYESLPRDGRPLWIVTVGRYPTYAPAAEALAHVRQVAPRAFIIP